MYLLISSTADITQLIPAVTNLSNFIQWHGSEKVLEPLHSWLAYVTKLNTQALYVMLTESTCVFYGSQNKHRLLPYTAVTGLLTRSPFWSLYSV